MADEAHRGQYGLTEKVVVKQKENGDLEAKTIIGTARIIRDSLSNATYIGFTGTPISSKDRSTREVFGDYIDIYDTTQTVEDGATRPVYYESRVIHLKLDENTLHLIDTEYDIMAQNADPYVIEKSKKELGQMEAILGADQTIDSLVSDILDHYENYRANILTGKAMIVAYSRPIAMKIYKRILELRPAWTEKVGVVMTQGNNDLEEWREIIGNKAHKDDLAKKFKDNSSPMKIAIVVDMIEINKLCKSFGSLEVLKDISLTIQTGEIYGLVGRSGAGKSTLLRCINALEPYQSGSLKIDGTEIKDLSKQQIRELRKGIGMIFQQFSLIERRSVYKNVALPMKCWKYDKNIIDKRVRELLELVEISDKIDARPSTLSGGQKQRVAIARALALDSHILLCDEATSALDPKTTQSVLHLLRDINQKLGLTIIVVTHQMEVVREVCDTISILENGKISAAGAVKEVFLQKPKALMTLLGKEDHTYQEDGEVVSFILSTDQLDAIHFTHDQFGAKILSTSTNDYKGLPFTEVVVTTTPSKTEDLKNFLKEQKFFYYAAGGQN